jgi:imidazolonepropionase
MSDVQILRDTDLRCEGPTITDIAPSLTPRTGEEVLDAAGRLVTPGLVDCHTHACWAGDRLGEWEQKLRGVPYLDILSKGGGIMATVRAVRAASQRTLTDLLVERLNGCLATGTTTIEVKSGYGLTTADELKMLRAIDDARAHWPGTIVATALLGHAVDPDQPDFVERTISETLPEVSREFPGVAVDAYVEKGAWSIADASRLFTKVRELGHPLRVHADQFNSLGMVAEAVRLGARSVDHLEATTDADCAHLARSSTIGVGLPICGFHVDGRYADLRRLIDAGGAVAVATNLNPGSAPSGSMPLAMGLAVRHGGRHGGLTPHEALTAGTVNGAAVLGFSDRGAFVRGLRADLIVWNTNDVRGLTYIPGGPSVSARVIGGVVRE